MKTTPSRPATLRLLATALALGFATDICASVVELDAGRLDLCGTLEADHVTIGADATLAGDGLIAAPTTVSGTLSPGAGPVETLGTLTFTDTLTFLAGSRYLCHATTATDLDRLVVAGAVTGTALFVGSRADDAEPDRQVVIDGGSVSDYGLFTSFDPDYWRLRISGDDLLVRYGLAQKGTHIVVLGN